VNIVLVHPADANAEGVYVVRDRRARHIREVLRAADGAHIRVGRRDGPLGEAEVRLGAGDGPRGAVELRCRWDEAAPEPWLDLAVGIPRPKQLQKLLPQLSAMGLRHLALLRTWRVQRPYLRSPLLRPEVHGALLEAGLMQGGRTFWPRVEFVERFEVFAERDFEPIGARLVADPRAPSDLADRDPGAVSAPVFLVVGPGGGLLPYEVERLAARGFEPTRFGPSTLRTDTACVAIAGQLDLHRRMALRR